MSADKTDFDAADRAIAAAPYVPPVAGRRIDRAIRMRDVIVALLVGYSMPSLLAGYMTYDFEVFTVKFAPPMVYCDDLIHLVVWDCDGYKVLDISWNEIGEVRLRRFEPSWWEQELTDINFWDEKVRWWPDDLAWTLNARDQQLEEHEGAALPYVAARMRTLRKEAEMYIQARMHAHYAIGDCNRGEKWWQLLEAMRFTPPEPSSKILQ